jgi:aminomethyltransferase
VRTPVDAKSNSLRNIADGALPFFPGSLGKAIGLGYVATEHAKLGTEIYIDIRNTLVKAKVVKFPFK